MERIYRETLQIIAREHWEGPPIHVSMLMNRLIMAETGVSDPYRVAKEQSNRFALQLVPEFAARITKIPDPYERFKVALSLSAAGNVVDFTCDKHIDLEDSLKDATEPRESGRFFSVDDSRELFDRLGRATSLLMFLDNSGEVVFDVLFLRTVSELFPGLGSVCIACKAGPLLNDVTKADCHFTGMDDLRFGPEKKPVHYLELGTKDFGMWPPSPPLASGRAPIVQIVTTPAVSFPEVFYEHSVVISKGQANYEAMSNWGKQIFFVLTVKCDPVAEDSGAQIGTRIVEMK